MENETIINGESTVKDKHTPLRLTLSLVQLILSLVFVLAFLIIKGFFPDYFEEVKSEYESKMYDSVFADPQDRGNIDLE